MSADHTALGRAVRIMRATRGLSQNSATAHGSHRNYIGAIERGKINPTFRILKLERGLDMPLCALIAKYEELLS